MRALGVSRPAGAPGGRTIRVLAIFALHSKLFLLLLD